MSDVDTGSHQTPASWAWTRVEAVCEKIQDGTHFSPKVQLASGKYPYITAKNVRPTGLDFSDLKYLREEDHREIYHRCDVREGDVLLVKDGVNAGDAAINTLTGEISLLSSVCFLRPRPHALLPGYLRYYLSSPQGRSRLTDNMTGTAIRRIILRRVKATWVPLAPLPEQQKLVDAIESYLTRLDAAVATLERVKANLKRYRASVLRTSVEGHLVPTEAELARKERRDYEPASVLLDRILKERRRRWEEGELAKLTATGKPPEDDRWKSRYKEPVAPDTSKLPELPEGWCWSSVWQLAVDVGTGATPRRGETRYYEQGNIPWITSGAVNQPVVSEADEHVTEAALAETNLTIYPPGTLLVAMYGEGKTRGKCAELRIPATTNQAIAAIVLGQGDDSLRRWLRLFFEYNYAATRRLSSGGVQPNLNLSIVRCLPVPLPPQAEQKRIYAEVDARLTVTDSLVSLEEANGIRCFRLRQAILKWAFEGKLVDQDPTDEPALVLLDRIKAERQRTKGVDQGKFPWSRKRKTA